MQSDEKNAGAERTENEHDMEAAQQSTVGGIVFGNDSSQKKALSLNVPTSSSRKCDTTIAALTTVYSLLLITLFVWPRQVSKNSNDGFQSLSEALVVIFAVGGSALIVAAVNLVLTLRRWQRLPGSTKIVGLLPTVCSIAVVIAVSVLVSIRRDTNTNDETPNTPKNEPAHV